VSKEIKGKKEKVFIIVGEGKYDHSKSIEKKLKLVRERLITKRRQRFFGVLCAKKE
jgi:hypothetical protein